MSLVRAALGLLLVGGAAVGQQRSVLPHIAAGGGWSTVITLVNRSPTKNQLTVTLRLNDDDGRALMLPVTTTQEGKSQTSVTASVTAVIGWNETLLIATGDQVKATVVGWADVRGTDEVGGFAIFRFTPPTGSASEGTVPLRTQVTSTLTLPFDDTAGSLMGVALANPGSGTADITATIWDDGGRLLGTQNFTIADNGHTSFVLPILIPLTVGKRGIVQFESGGRTGVIDGLGLRFSSFGSFTSVPPL